MQGNRDELTFIGQELEGEALIGKAHAAHRYASELRLRMIDEGDLEFACEVRIPANLIEELVDRLHEGSCNYGRSLSPLS